MFHLEIVFLKNVSWLPLHSFLGIMLLYFHFDSPVDVPMSHLEIVFSRIFHFFLYFLELCLCFYFTISSPSCERSNVQLWFFDLVSFCRDFSTRVRKKYQGEGFLCSSLFQDSTHLIVFNKNWILIFVYTYTGWLRETVNCNLLLKKWKNEKSWQPQWFLES